MWYTIGMMMARALYSAFRGTLKKAIDDPKRDWDEKTMAATDMFFGKITVDKAKNVEKQLPEDIPDIN